MPPPTEETLLLVIVVAIVANLCLGLALLVVPRMRRRARARAEADLAPIRPSARGWAGSGGWTGSGGSGAGASGAADGVARGIATFGPTGDGPGADPQTGLDASPAWTRWLREEETRIRRYRRPATVVLVELEGLDRLIERIGPDAGDRLIPPIAATMRRHARESDRIARIGPARFGALLAETDEVAAINYVERVRTTCDLWLAAGAVALRLSIGWAEANASRSMQLTLETAEGRLNVERHRDRPEPGSAVPPAPLDAAAPRTSPAT